MVSTQDWLPMVLGSNLGEGRFGTLLFRLPRIVCVSRMRLHKWLVPLIYMHIYNIIYNSVCARGRNIISTPGVNVQPVVDSIF